MSDIFMSYASEDRPRGEEFARALEGQGWTVFSGPDEIPIVTARLRRRLDGRPVRCGPRRPTGPCGLVAGAAERGAGTGVSLTELALRMKNEPSVTSAVIGATKVLAAADKTPEFFEQGCDKDPQVKDFYRGMLLAHAGYYLVLSELRTGTYKNYRVSAERLFSARQGEPLCLLDERANLYKSGGIRMRSPL